VAPLSNTFGQIWKTRFAWALALVVAINAFLSALQPAARVNAASLPSTHTWEWWRTQSYEQLKTPPDVVLMGSSLMMIPISFLDADYLHKELDAVHHYRSVYFENSLAKAGTGQDLTCFNFAIPGGMVSDDYMIVRALMHEEKRPKLIVIGLTLRDFIESHVSCAASTSTFRYFRHFFDIDDIADLAMPEIWQRFDYWQGKVLYMLGQRLDMQVLFGDEIKKIARSALGDSTGKAPLEAPVLTANLARNLKSEAEEGDFPLKPGQVWPYEDNSAEYKKRFSNPSKKLFAAEAVFLDKTLALMAKDDTRVLIVNMPLTAANMALMPAGYYQRYMDTLHSTCANYQCSILDLNDGKSFALSDFRDTAHMNSSGGKKLLDAIVGKVRSDERMPIAFRKDAAAAETHAIAGHGGPL
jgi:hypothetical protein